MTFSRLKLDTFQVTKTWLRVNENYSEHWLKLKLKRSAKNNTGVCKVQVGTSTECTSGLPCREKGPFGWLHSPIIHLCFIMSAVMVNVTSFLGGKMSLPPSPRDRWTFIPVFFSFFLRRSQWSTFLKGWCQGIPHPMASNVRGLMHIKAGGVLEKNKVEYCCTVLSPLAGLTCHLIIVVTSLRQPTLLGSGMLI